MVRITVTRGINAPVDLIFKAVSDIEQLPEVVPEVVKTEFLSEVRSGMGTRFRETRLMNRKESVTELEVTEYVANDRVRMIADSHGTVWDSVFTVKAIVAKSELTLTMDAKAYKLIPRLLNPFLKGLFKKGLEKHMDEVKAYCEKRVRA